jgi:hypothetical protein
VTWTCHECGMLVHGFKPAQAVPVERARPLTSGRSAERVTSTVLSGPSDLGTFLLRHSVAVQRLSSRAWLL